MVSAGARELFPGFHRFRFPSVQSRGSWPAVLGPAAAAIGNLAPSPCVAQRAQPFSSLCNSLRAVLELSPELRVSLRSIPNLEYPSCMSTSRYTQIAASFNRTPARTVSPMVEGSLHSPQRPPRWTTAVDICVVIASVSDMGAFHVFSSVPFTGCSHVGGNSPAAKSSICMYLQV